MTTRVCLDACVLYPTVLREILVGCASKGLFKPVWSARILEEWARATPKLGAGAETVARREIEILRSEWPEAEIPPREADLKRLSLPDPNDVHVLASAIAGHADAICTFNARDFPRATLAEEGLVRLDPDQFLQMCWGRDPDAVREVVTAIHRTAERLSGEVWPIRDLLKRARLPKLGKAMTR
ncbi:RSP_2648 family PIN domain-containing protein [Palleronia sp. LCG004]|uniref:RSP_2648 family PIN domain-containing protein n=1 Tax=Palleronia sp. LCG004 TaxID=3079304 RepID=UPI00294303B4|nr:PIN domain-containing protein [Palleronia sp. LCG004]WOI55181.1 PIN domain-containing protein [Palleronia sp. LCG004]